MARVPDSILFNEWRARVLEVLADDGIADPELRLKTFNDCQPIFFAYLSASLNLDFKNLTKYRALDREKILNLQRVISDLDLESSSESRSIVTNLKRKIALLKLEPTAQFADPLVLRNRFIADIADLYVCALNKDWREVKPGKTEGNKLVGFVSLICNFAFDPDNDAGLSLDQYFRVLKKHRKLVEQTYIGA